MAAASQDEAAFMAALLGDLNASMFSEPLSSPGRAATPKRVPLSQRIVNVKPCITTPLAKRPVKHVEIAATPIVDDTLDDLCDGIAWSDFDTDMEPEELPRKLQVVQCTAGEVVKRTVWLQDDWYETQVRPDDIVNLVGPLQPNEDVVLSLSNPNNWLILHPDTLLTATAISTSVPCPRKPLLQDRVKSSGGTSEPLLYGNLLHELFQSCLLEDNFSPDFRLAAAKKLTSREEAVSSAWELNKDVAEILDEVLSRSAEWQEWAATYVSNSPNDKAVLADKRALENDQDRVCVSDVHDIEEDIWSPALGMKGKIDVSVQARIQGQSATTAEASKRGVVAPFEIKTGRNIAGMEHRAQTMLYTLLMSDRYDRDVSSGLLYYTQTGEVQRVEHAKNEIRGLVQARNTLAHYTSLRSSTEDKPETPPASPVKAAVDDPRSEDVAMWAEFDEVEETPASRRDLTLPEPLDEFRTCRRCYQVDACMLYRKAVEPHPFPSSAQESGLLDLYENKTSHLSSDHLHFFREWDRLVSLEEKELVRYRKEMWTVSATERQELGRCIPDLCIDRSFATEDSKNLSKMHRFTYRLVRFPLAASASLSQASIVGDPFDGGILGVGDLVVVSMVQPDILAIARGFVLELSADSVVLGLDHALTDLPCAGNRTSAKTSFRIDKDELSSGLGRLRDNLAQLFYAEGDHKRRNLIVDLQQPRFNRLTDSHTPPAHLNVDQQAAIDLVLKAQDYALILGMPGTGKTTTIAEIIVALVAQKKSVLLTSYTHSAVDNILLKLLGRDVDILRLGNQEKVLPQVQHLTLGAMGAVHTVAELDERFMSPQVVATTALSINHSLFSKRTFDYCIVDEASQITLPAALGPLRFADTFILVGDHHQLPPLVRNPVARQQGYETSLFKLLSDSPHAEAATAELKLQYRMTQAIMSISSALYYEQKLAAGSEEVANQRLQLPQLDRTLARLRATGESGAGWLAQVLDPSRPVIFADMDALNAPENKLGRMITNEAEATAILQSVRAFTEAGVHPTEIGVLALYRSQIKLLNSVLSSCKGVEVLTADQSQGRDKAVVLISFVRSNDALATGDLLKDWRRLNVCFTRAKTKLVMFGSRRTLAEPLKDLFAMVDARSWGLELGPNALEQHSVRKRLLSSPVKGRQAKRSQLGVVSANSPRRPVRP